MAARKSILEFLSDKLKLIAGIITATGVICTLVWGAFKQIEAYNELKTITNTNKIKIDTLEAQNKRFRRDFWHFKKENVLTTHKADIAYEIAGKNARDYFYHGIRFKVDNEGLSYYYFTGGNLFRAIWDPQSNNFYYEGLDGESHWCE